LRRLRGRDDTFEVQRIIRSFVDARWLRDFDELLAEYQSYADGGGMPEGE
jgi:hypothetical protein